MLRLGDEKLCGSKGENVIADRRKLHNEKLHELFELEVFHPEVFVK